MGLITCFENESIASCSKVKRVTVPVVPHQNYLKTFSVGRYSDRNSSAL
jgi:hypothetical protein